MGLCHRLAEAVDCRGDSGAVLFRRLGREVSAVKLRLERGPSAHGATIGELTVDGAFECYTCEDEDRKLEDNPDAKIKGKTAIPRGAYNVVVTESTRFKRPLPLLENVMGFSGIRIHPGNSSEDTEGCLLPGRTRTDRTVGESKVAFNQLFGKIKDALDSGDTVSIEIV